jgi:hypothetical protein
MGGTFMLSARAKVLVSLSSTREGGIDVRGGQSRRTRPDRQPRATGVLRLDGQQPPSDLLSAARRIATQQLCHAALRGHRLNIGARSHP